MIEWSHLLVGGLGLFFVMTLLWACQLKTRNAGSVDVVWALGTGIVGCWFVLQAEGLPLRRLLIGAVLLIWSFRLGWHIWRRLVADAEEDGRYAALREKWGDDANRNLFLFFQVQGLLALLFALPAGIAASNDQAISLFDWLGLSVGLLAIVGETVADRQLAAFKRVASKSQVCDRGFWRYSRHPNYFFEWLHWWVYPLFAIGYSLGWVTLFAPVIMLLFLYRITGSPATEARATLTRGGAYRRYQRETSAFFPWLPKVDKQ